MRDIVSASSGVAPADGEHSSLMARLRRAPRHALRQLRVRDRRRRTGHQALRGGGLGERDDVADRFGAGHQRGDAVDAEGDAAVRRRAVLQRVEQEAELGFGLFRADAEQLEHRALHVRAMDADRTAADLVAVEHHVVAARHRGLRIGAQVGDVVHRRRGEGMMQGDVALRFLVPFEHREVGDPQRRPAVLDQAEVLADLQAQRAHEVADRVVAAGAEEHQVAVAAAPTCFTSAANASSAKNFGDRRS